MWEVDASSALEFVETHGELGPLLTSEPTFESAVFAGLRRTLILVAQQVGLFI